MPNRLSAETSPYLLQHADNPVDWHPWCEEALALARDQDKPILLSIGYSACHWCHVMAHESFEDAETAAAMNECFVNIKVDREERPDLDQIYQSAHTLMLRRNGGWPLTMFLTPDQMPFYGGTYFPPVPRYNLPGFRDLVRQVAAAYREHRDEIARQGEPLRAALAQAGTQRNVVMADAGVIDEGVAQLVQAFDAEHGGFGAAPKFPNEADWVLLMRQAAAGEAGARAMLERTLNGMAKGGLYDHLGGGFCRYSVDAQWQIPHFEKMLYTNAQLLCLYADGWLLVGEPRWQEVVSETIGWMLREMRAPEGGFHSALDADSEGEEGRFYVWSREEARAVLDEREYALAAAFYGLSQAPNFEHAWHLHVEESLAAVAQDLGLGMDEAADRLAALRAKLLAVREKRVRPGLDDKLLTSWNALAIKGLARAGRVFDEPGWIDMAQQAADFLRTTMWQDGRLLATCKAGRAHLNAYLDDHAFLLDAMLELLQAHFRPQDLALSIALADALLARFEDPAGGFYFTSHDHEPLIHRPKPAHDGAMPSGNGIAAFALQRLGHLLGETRYLEAAERTLAAFSADMRASPAATPSLLVALEEWLEPPTTVVLRGEASALAQWKRALDARLVPRCLVVAISQGIETGFPTLDKKASDRVNAHVCRGVECLPAINKQDDLVSLILR